MNKHYHQALVDTIRFKDVFTLMFFSHDISEHTRSQLMNDIGKTIVLELIWHDGEKYPDIGDVRTFSKREDADNFAMKIRDKNNIDGIKEE